MDKEATIRALMRDVDRSLVRENLKRTPAERLEKFFEFHLFVCDLSLAGEKARTELASNRAQRL